jgi:hypothetical protein
LWLKKLNLDTNYWPNNLNYQYFSQSMSHVSRHYRDLNLSTAYEPYLLRWETDMQVTLGNKIANLLVNIGVSIGTVRYDKYKIWYAESLITVRNFLLIAFCIHTWDLLLEYMTWKTGFWHQNMHFCFWVHDIAGFVQSSKLFLQQVVLYVVDTRSYIY